MHTKQGWAVPRKLVLLLVLPKKRFNTSIFLFIQNNNSGWKTFESVEWKQKKEEQANSNLKMKAQTTRKDNTISYEKTSAG